MIYDILNHYIKERSKRINIRRIALCLTVIMVLTLLPLGSFADEYLNHVSAEGTIAFTVGETGYWTGDTWEADTKTATFMPPAEEGPVVYDEAGTYGPEEDTETIDNDSIYINGGSYNNIIVQRTPSGSLRIVFTGPNPPQIQIDEEDDEQNQ